MTTKMIKPRFDRVFVPIILFICSLAVLFVFKNVTPMNGDTYAYAHSLSSFAGPTFHYGYFAIGFAFHSFFKLFGLNPMETLCYMSVLFGSVCVVGMYFFTLEITKKRYLSLLAAFILLFSGTFWVFAEHGEVYVPQLAFVLFAAVSMLKEKPLFAVVLLLVATFITPTSGLAFFPLLYIAYQRNMSKRQFAIFLVPAILFFILAFLLAFHSISGFTRWIFSPMVHVSDISVLKGFLIVICQFIMVYVKPFNLFFLFACVGLIITFRRYRERFYLIAAFVLPFMIYTLNISLFSGDHLIITYVVVSFAAACGLYELLHFFNAGKYSKQLIAVALLAVHVIISYVIYIYPKERDTQELGRVISEFSTKYQQGGIIISEYSFGTAFWYLTQPETDYMLLTGRPNYYLRYHCPVMVTCMERLKHGFWINTPQIRDFMQLWNEHKELFRSKPIFFIDHDDWTTGAARSILPDTILRIRSERKRQMQKVKTDIEEILGVQTEFRNVLSSPLYPVYRIELR